MAEVVEAHISKGKPEKHQTAHRITNPKTRVYFCRKRKTESEIEQKLQTAIVINTQKPKFFCTKTGKSIYKMAETPKPKLPMSPLNSIGFESTYSVDSDFRFSVAASILWTDFSTSVPRLFSTKEKTLSLAEKSPGNEVDRVPSSFRLEPILLQMAFSFFYGAISLSKVLKVCEWFMPCMNERSKSEFQFSISPSFSW